MHCPAVAHQRGSGEHEIHLNIPNSLSKASFMDTMPGAVPVASSNTKRTNRTSFEDWVNSTTLVIPQLYGWKKKQSEDKVLCEPVNEFVKDWRFRHFIHLVICLSAAQ